MADSLQAISNYLVFSIRKYILIYLFLVFRGWYFVFSSRNNDWIMDLRHYILRRDDLFSNNSQVRVACHLSAVVSLSRMRDALLIAGLGFQNISHFHISYKCKLNSNNMLSSFYNYIL